tara:strand:- start:2614 stop:2826 length:213 start_codon:yes stop_codon:yes gene_type:complete
MPGVKAHLSSLRKDRNFTEHLKPEDFPPKVGGKRRKTRRRKSPRRKSPRRKTKGARRSRRTRRRRRRGGS